ncbi:MAG: alpha/beta hydrolase [Euryarchaeota archaeon]|nr:alpha/beta hydrolase [Euryarchaeota archaeon]MDE1835537.1 alpha/beta hydrolase [Euryarchaeota archaeon]MDE1879628.1 alpha/beta hydrolase [Euryarchaeota archaeon]MDE2043841.1 alpha/beta hydrolase [Thermoplasmata archaeon]
MATADVLPHDDRGSGSPIVLLHGFPLHRGVWKGQLDPFAVGNRVVAFDLPGYGQASTIRPPETLEGVSAVVESSTHALASPPAVVIGHSLGGYLALHKYGEHPERVRALVLTNTRAEADSEEAAAKRYATIARLRQEGPGGFAVETARNLLAPNNVGNPDLFPAVLQIVRASPVPAMIASLVALAGRPDFTSLLPEVRVPTLVIWGEEDRTIPPKQSKALVDAIPGAKGVGIPGAGHLPFLENPSAFNQAVLEFLAALPSLEEGGAPAKAAPASK